MTDFYRYALTRVAIQTPSSRFASQRIACFRRQVSKAGRLLGAQVRSLYTDVRYCFPTEM